MPDAFVRPDLAAGSLGQEPDLLDWAARASSRAPADAVFRDREGRRTIRLTIDGVDCFLKLHTGIGWREIAKNLLRLSPPVTGAATEYRALCRLHAAGVPVPRVLAFAERGGNPARRCSMLLTEALPGTVSAERLFGANSPSGPARRRLVRETARIVRAMHDAGFHHRDCYLDHVHVELGSLEPESLEHSTPRCYLIDLHRARHRPVLPRRWRIRDVAGLAFSSADLALTRRDHLRFLAEYSAGGLRAALGQEASFWRAVARRARQVYRRHWHRALGRAAGDDPVGWIVRSGPPAKKEPTGLVGRVLVDGADCFAKLDRRRPWLGRLRHLAGLTRAQRACRVGDHLAAAHLPIARPMASAASVDGVLLLSRAVADSVGYREQLADGSDDPAGVRLMTGAGESLRALHGMGYRHGDYKWDNLVWNGDRCIVLDLDGCRRAPRPRSEFARDLARFVVDVEEAGLPIEAVDAFIDAYLRGSTASRDCVVADMRPWLRTFRERHARRYGTRSRPLIA